MTSDRWRQIEDLCHAVLARPAEERAAFMAHACAGDEVLRREVESLLAQESRAGTFMSVPAAALVGPEALGQAKGTLVGQRLGAYAVRSLLGVGGMGEVYRAHDTRLGREVAIKVLPPAFTADPARRARFEREARMLATVNHPHIGAIYGVEDADGVQGLVLELVEGQTLAERIGRGLQITEAHTIARQIADALDAAHEKGIVHRDLKPANIKITPDGVVKVLDFGLAKAASTDGSNRDLTDSREGVILGTAAYMSPEQVRGLTVDKRADIWAFGCVLYEMLTGRVAFAGDTVSDTIGKVLEREPDWSALPAGTPAPTRRLLLRCLAKDPRQRLRDIGDVSVDIDDAPLEATDGAVTRESPTKWLPWVAVGALAGGLALALALWAPWRSAPQQPTLRLRADLSADSSLATTIMTQFGDATVLSPDGTVVAFVAQNGQTGRPQLYVRRLDQLQATPLSGTEGPLTPFFSPDGRWIGFGSSDHKLKKIAVTGGAPATLSDGLLELRGGSWGDDGTIVFSPNKAPGTPLMRVTAEGGKPEPLTSFAEGEVTQQWPQILPGGKGVLYTSSTVVGAFNDASLVVWRGGTRKVIQRGGFYGRYLPSGHLIYIHDGTLFAAPFDIDRLELTGPAAPALEGVKSNSVTGGAQVAVSGSGTLVYLPGPMTGAAIPLDWMNHEGTTSPLRVASANWSHPRFAPDGGKLAMNIVEGGSDIWIYEWASGRLGRLTSDPSQDTTPVWTPDGRRVTFASTRGDKSTLNLWWQRADLTGEPQRLTVSRNAQEPGSWHRSGKFLAFEENLKVMILRMEGDEASGWKPGTPYLFSNGPFRESDPMFSPDGRWLAYMSDEQGTGRIEVYVRPFPGPGATWQVSTGGGLQPTWSPTRNELFYGLNGQIYVVPFTVDGGTFRPEKPRLWSEQRYETRGTSRMFDLHPDGERFALAPATQTPIGEKLDKVVFIFNFFDELRRIAPVSKR